MTRTRSTYAFLFFCSLVLAIISEGAFGIESHLVLIGGGNSPEPAIKQLMEWAGNGEANILFIPWGSSQPQSTFQSMGSRFYPYSPKNYEIAVTGSEFSNDIQEKLPYDEFRKRVVDEICKKVGTAEGKKKLISQIMNATAIFFGGGDQDFIMDVLEKNSDVKDLLKKRFQEGIVFGGTSAGTAIMSQTMVSQKTETSYYDYYTRGGLGLLPAHVIVDQHFFKRPMRIKRLTYALNKGTESIGVGIDEDNAVLVVNGEILKVVGEGKVWIKDKLASPQITILKGSEGWELMNHKKLNLKSIATKQ